MCLISSKVSLLLGLSQGEPLLGGSDIKCRDMSLGSCARQTPMGNIKESKIQIPLTVILDKTLLNLGILFLKPLQI